MGKISLRVVDSVPCEFCGKIIFRTRRQATRGKKFCDKMCSNRLHNKSKIKNFCNCLNCGKEFLAFTKKNGHRKRYCSPKCKSEHKRTLLECEFCGGKFRAYGRDKEKRYCSWECRKAANPVPQAELVCINCKKDFRRDVAQAFRSDKNPLRDVFCSKDCAWEYNRGENNVLYLGNRKADRGPTWKEQRKKALDVSREICCFCGEAVSGREACVDHIVPFRLFKELPDGKNLANDLTNLWVLCRSCHSKKTQAEVRILYSLGFEKFAHHVKGISARDVEADMRRAHDYWVDHAAFAVETKKSLTSPETVVVSKCGCSPRWQRQQV